MRRRLHDGRHLREAASLAGHLKLDNLCWIYDNNHITIEGNTALAFSDVATRFIGHGWNVTRVGDANDLEMLERAFTTFKSTSDRPTLIIVDSHIAYGAPNKQDTSAAHGEPLGEERSGWRSVITAGRQMRSSWSLMRYSRISRRASGHAAWRCTEPGGLSLRSIDANIPNLPIRAIACCAASCRMAGTGISSVFSDGKAVATRDASGQALNALAKNVPWMLGGSADLGPSCKTRLAFEGAGDFSAQNPAGRNLHFGIREHAMGAILNGLSLSKIRPFGSGFLIFSDYGRAAIRLSA